MPTLLMPTLLMPTPVNAVKEREAQFEFHSSCNLINNSSHPDF